MNIMVEGMNCLTRDKLNLWCELAADSSFSIALISALSTTPVLMPGKGFCRVGEIYLSLCA